MLRQLGGKVSCCFCLDRKISGFLFVALQSKDVNVEVLINELTPPVNSFFTLGYSLPGLWQEEHLQLMKGWKDPSGTASEPGFAKGLLKGI